MSNNILEVLWARAGNANCGSLHTPNFSLKMTQTYTDWVDRYHLLCCFHFEQRTLLIDRCTCSYHALYLWFGKIKCWYPRIDWDSLIFPLVNCARDFLYGPMSARDWLLESSKEPVFDFFFNRGSYANLFCKQQENWKDPAWRHVCNWCFQHLAGRKTITGIYGQSI